MTQYQKLRVRAQDLQIGDILTFDNVITNVANYGIDVPPGKTEITYQKKGDMTTVQKAYWNKTTTILVKRPLDVQSPDL